MAHTCNTWQLYSGTAEIYDRSRRRYPPRALDIAVGRWLSSAQTRMAVDVGSGTGIFTRLLAERLGPTAQVIGVEPNDHMRAQAALSAGSFPNLAFVPGCAEDLPIPSGSSALVTAATAAHWFDRSKFYAEALRVLSAGGTIAVVQNKRRYWDSVFFEEFEYFQERNIPGYMRGKHSNYSGQYSSVDFLTEIRKDEMLENVEKQSIEWSEAIHSDVFREFCFSMGHMKKAIEINGLASISAQLDQLIASHVDESGMLEAPYVTEVTLGTRRSG